MSLLWKSPIARLCFVSALCALLWGASAPGAHAADDEAQSQFKAVFVYNFIQYVKWPEASQTDTIRVGVLGESPVVKSLQEISEKRQVRGKRLEVKGFADSEAIEPCMVLFVPEAHASDLEAVRLELESRNVLLIGDKEGFAAKGVAINFVVVDDKLRFEINRGALKRAGLTVGAQLLKLAILVDEGEAR